MSSAEKKFSPVFVRSGQVTKGNGRLKKAFKDVETARSQARLITGVRAG